MEMSGERLIKAPPSKVWDALNDPVVLQVCIPGCESIEMQTPTQMIAIAAVKIGPMAARFTGKVTLSDLDPPNGYKISGEGKGGAAGFAKGGADVRLAAQAGGTLLTYAVKAQVGGKMAQIGGRLIDATAKGLAEQFFTRFAANVEVEPKADATTDAAPVTAKVGIVGWLIKKIRSLFLPHDKVAGSDRA